MKNAGRLFCYSPLAIAACALVLVPACTLAPVPAARGRTTLKDACKGSFLIGVAINADQFSDKDSRGCPIIKSQFDSITPENALKWESVHPKPDAYDFEAADRYVDFGERNHMAIIGHTLVWHSQTPKWVFQNDKGEPVDRETLLNRMHDHIQTVVGRYKGRIKGWDVVNEALEEDGSFRQSPWMKIIGEEYIAKAFEYAHEADPSAELHYNDYSLENEPKRNGAVALVTKLKAQGLPITAVGIQGHVKLNWPSPEQEEAAINAFAKLGVKVMITELDIDVIPATQANRSAEITQNGVVAPAARPNPYTNGLPDSVQQALTKRYAELFGVFFKNRGKVERVTLWGVTDGDSWLNSHGRVNYPLLFDRKGQPKPALDAILKESGK